MGPDGGPPELLTRMCTLFSFDHSFTTCLTLSGLEKSATKTWCCCLKEMSKRAIASSKDFLFRANKVQCAPIKASCSATAKPIPCELPQTSAFFPSNDKFIGLKPKQICCNFWPLFAQLTISTLIRKKT